MIHYPKANYEIRLPEGYCFRTVKLPGETALVAEFINCCYSGIYLNRDEIIKWMQYPAFENELWVFIMDKSKMLPVALGIGDFDSEIAEGSLEWIQVLPEFRGRGLGKSIVLELLSRLKNMADFITVSGEVDNPANPESLYRKCGFAGDDIWYVFRNKSKDMGDDSNA